MKYFFHNNIVIRTPLRPFKKKFSRACLKELLAKDDIREALFLSSPELLTEFEKSGNGFFEQADKKLSISLLKYIYRMHARCTPFGLFAGCSVSSWGDSYELSEASLNRSTRLDMEFTCALVQVLEKSDFIRPYLKYYPNTSLYHDGRTLRYIEYYFSNKNRIHQLCEVEYDEYIKQLILCASNGATIQDLIGSLMGFDLSLDDASSFIADVISAQLLVSELVPSVTGDELLTRTLKTLKLIQDQNPGQQLQYTINRLANIQKKLKNIDTATGNAKELYLQIARDLEIFNIPYDLGKLFQTDVFKNIKKVSQDKSKEEAVKDELIRAIQILRNITPKFEELNLAEFKSNFFSRYEYQEVALLEALDNEWGVGYGGHNSHTSNSDPFLERLNINAREFQDREVKWDKHQSFLFQKLLKAKSENAYTVVLTEMDVREFEDHQDDLPATLAVTFNYIKGSYDEYQLVIKNIGGPTANHLLGRFAAVDPSINRIANLVSASEKAHYEPSLLAALSHLPESRIGNVLVKPMLRDFEISYLSNGSFNKDKQIPLDDLYISLRNNRLYLRSKGLNKEIIPRIDNAHNFRHKALPLYHFLGDLQTQGLKNGVYFHWGFLANEFKFLPRVQIGRVIVFRATWQLIKNDYTDLISDSSEYLSESALLALLSNWRLYHNLPELVLLIDGDNELLINFEDEFSLIMFISIIKNRSSIILKEFLFDSNNASVKNEAGDSFTNEMIGILNCEKDIKKNDEIIGSLHSEPENIVERKFPVGSEWLYYKIYCGKKTADLLLENEIKQSTADLLRQGIADQWFFVRYNDPDPHIRLRIHLPDLDNIGIAVNYMQACIKSHLKSNLIWKLQTETYQRELERYGQSSIKISEEIFFRDSTLMVNVMHLIREDADLRFLFGLKAVDLFLGMFNLSALDKLDFFRELERNHLKEFSKDMKERVNNLFREKTVALRNIFNCSYTDSDELNIWLEEWTQQVKPLTRLLLLKVNDSKEVPINKIISAHIHMFLNRVFRGHQRTYELVVYSFLHRMYRSEVAKNKPK